MELRIAARRLLSDPWAAGAAIMAAALGAGLNTAVFAVAYGVLLRPLPYAHADRLVFIEVDAALSRVAEWRRHLTAFDRVTGYARDRLTVRGAGEPRLAGVAAVDEEFFDTLDARPEAGSPFRRGGPTTGAGFTNRFPRPAGAPPPPMPGPRPPPGVPPV